MTSALPEDCEDVGSVLMSTAHPPGCEPWMVGAWLDRVSPEAARKAAQRVDREMARLIRGSNSISGKSWAGPTDWRPRPLVIPLVCEIALEGM